MHVVVSLQSTTFCTLALQPVLVSLSSWSGRGICCTCTVLHLHDVVLVRCGSSLSSSCLVAARQLRCSSKAGARLVVAKHLAMLGHVQLKVLRAAAQNSLAAQRVGLPAGCKVVRAHSLAVRVLLVLICTQAVSLVCNRMAVIAVGVHSTAAAHSRTTLAAKQYACTPLPCVCSSSSSACKGQAQHQRDSVAMPAQGS